MWLSQLASSIWPLASTRPQALQGCRPLSRTDCGELASALEAYAEASFYCAAVSLGEGISDALQNRFSWAAVKSYYSVFYSIRSIIARDSRFIYSVGRDQLSVRVSPGETPKRVKGSTHEATFAIFRNSLPQNAVLSGEIELSDPLDWMKSLRNNVSYRSPRFVEPDVPVWIRAFSQRPRHFLSGYLAHQFNAYTFDKDHSAIAFPMAVLWEAKRSLRPEFSFGPEDDAHLRSVCNPKQGEFFTLLRQHGAV